jgi:hypothetical protein
LHDNKRLFVAPVYLCALFEILPVLPTIAVTESEFVANRIGCATSSFGTGMQPAQESTKPANQPALRPKGPCSVPSLARLTAAMTKGIGLRGPEADHGVHRSE